VAQSLYEALRGVKSEEDVKDRYIKALGLESYTKGLIDIQTKEVWFEAKDTGKHSTYSQFTQLLHYVQVALDKGEHVPAFLAVIDTEKAAIMRSSDVIPFLAKKTVKWGKSASKYTQEALEEISAHIGTYFVSFRIQTNEQEFLDTLKNAIKSGDIIRTQITPANLKQVFDKWVDMIGREVKGCSEDDYALLFYADVMHDGKVETYHGLPARLAQINNAPAFILHDKLYELENKEGYRRFWAIYHRPPHAEYRNYLLERRDSLIPVDKRMFEGAYYTPLAVVDKAYDKLNELLGANWQREYFVWDMCCGVGNLEVKHSNHRRIFMSTLDDADLRMMQSTKTCAAASRFQYDYLNDDVKPDGSIDYELTKKVPPTLRQAIADGKKILVLINPPYAESTNADNTLGKGGGESKASVASTAVGRSMTDYGYAARELFVQFLVRIAREIPNATVACFSTLKHVNAPNFEPFRERWSAKYLGGFIVHSKAFEGLNGDFPIGFLIWKLDPKGKPLTELNQITTDVLDKKATPIGTKTFFSIASIHLLGDWIARPRANKQDALPLGHAFWPAKGKKDVRGTKWADDAIGGMICKGSDMQNAPDSTAFLSSGYASAGGLFVTRQNIDQAAVVFAVRRVMPKRWTNNRDQFLAPAGQLPDEFVNDCLVWALFDIRNYTASAQGLKWNNRDWNLVNHFVPYTEGQVGAPAQFESDFMSQHLATKNLSQEACAVLEEGRKLWSSYFDHVDTHSVRAEYRLERPDVGWYQIRHALRLRNSSGDYPPVTFDGLDAAHDALGDKIRPDVYTHGFLLASM
jgi:hypothetical protein